MAEWEQDRSFEEGDLFVLNLEEGNVQCFLRILERVERLSITEVVNRSDICR